MVQHWPNSIPFTAVQLRADGEGWTTWIFAKDKGERAFAGGIANTLPAALLHQTSECCQHLINKTWKGAFEAASITAQGRPSRPPLALHCAWFAKASAPGQSPGQIWFSHHPSGEAGTPGTSANPGLCVSKFLKFCWPLLFLCGCRSETEREQRKQLVCLNKGQTCYSRGNGPVLFCNEQHNTVRSHR